MIEAPPLTAAPGEILLTRTGDDPAVTALVRPCGAYILGLQVDGVPLLTSPGRNPHRPDEQPPAAAPDEPVKMDAAHSMVPVGKTAGQAVDRHGNSRYRTYDVDGDPAAGELVLTAHDDDYALTHTKTVSLLRDGLRVSDRLEQDADAESRLSIGEHFYIPVRQADISDIIVLNGGGNPTQLAAHQMDGAALTGTFQDMDPALQAGETFYFVLPESGRCEFAFPDGRVITVSAAVESSDGQAISTGLFIWHRPGSDTLCIEPLAGAHVADSDGVQGALTNTGIRLLPGVTACLTSSITVATAA